MSTERTTATSRSRWLNLSFSAALGGTFLVIGLARDQPGLGVSGLVIMLAYGAVLELLRRRSEAAHLLTPGSRTDERQQQISLAALATTGSVLVVVLVGGAFWTYATDSAASSIFGALCAVGGLTFVLSTIWFSRRA